MKVWVGVVSDLVLNSAKGVEHTLLCQLKDPLRCRKEIEQQLTCLKHLVVLTGKIWGARDRALLSTSLCSTGDVGLDDEKY